VDLESWFRSSTARRSLDFRCSLLFLLWFLVGDGIVWPAVGGSDRSEMRRLGVFGSRSGRYRTAG
ncbi:hypothetical protein HID58_066456, partial [Brassica napus]